MGSDFSTPFPATGSERRGEATVRLKSSPVFARGGRGFGSNSFSTGNSLNDFKVRCVFVVLLVVYSREVVVWALDNFFRASTASHWCVH
jgi:hypothetical protein